jgi:hypothetical protein
MHHAIEEERVASIHHQQQMLIKIYQLFQIKHIPHV